MILTMMYIFIPDHTKHKLIVGGTEMCQMNRIRPDVDFK